MREVEEALARWRDAERRFNESEPGSLDHAVVESECNDAHAEYERLVSRRRTEEAETELPITEAPAL